MSLGVALAAVGGMERKSQCVGLLTLVRADVMQSFCSTPGFFNRELGENLASALRAAAGSAAPSPGLQEELSPGGYPLTSLFCGGTSKARSKARESKPAGRTRLQRKPRERDAAGRGLMSTRELQPQGATMGCAGGQLGMVYLKGLQKCSPIGTAPTYRSSSPCPES